ncbi:MAG: glycosyltransferase family A protein, partial [Actinomycetota bacterium]
MDAAAVSVVVPVRDAERYLDESLRSIHEQTLHDFEVVVFDDGSTDRSIDIARNWADKDARFKLFSSSYPLGLTGSSNEAVRLSAAPIVARMDADDIAHPDRLRRQLHAILAADDVVIVGTLTDGIDRSGKRIKTRDRGRVLKPAPFH